MPSEKNNNGLEELRRLSLGLTKAAHQADRQREQDSRHKTKIQGVQQGLRGISVSVALNQLKTKSTPEIVRVVESLKSKQGTAELRRLIINLAHDLERCAANPAAAGRSKMSVEAMAGTLAILIELFFSLE